MGRVKVGVQELISDVTAATTSLELKSALRHVVREHGFEFFQLQRFKRRLCIDSPWLELPPATQVSAVSPAGGRADVIATLSLEKDLAFWWYDLVQQPDAAESVRTFIVAFEKCGLSCGLTVPVHGAGGVCDVLHVWARADAKSEKHDISRHNPGTLAALSAAAYLCCTRLRQLDRPVFAPAAKGATLSARELEVLRWCKDGKSYSEIGIILGISSKTVEFHIANVMRKLGVNQKITAIVAAMRQGLIGI